MRTLLPGMISTKFNTAVCFALLGIVIVLRVYNKWQTVQLILLIFVLSVGGITLCEYLFGWHIGLDNFFWKGGADILDYPNAGRPSLSASVSFFLLALALLITSRDRARIFTWIVISLVLVTALMGTLSYLLGIPYVIRMPGITEQAFLSSICFINLCVSIYFLNQRGYEEVSFRQKLAGGFLIILLVLSLVFYLNSENDEHYRSTTEWIENTNALLGHSEQIVSGIENVQSDIRGFLLTGKDEMLNATDQELYEIKNNLGDFEKAAILDTTQHKRIDSLINLMRNRLLEFDRIKQIIKQGPYEKSLFTTLIVRNNKLTDSIHQLIHRMQVAATAQLEKRKNNNKHVIENFQRIINFFGIIVVLVLLALLYIVFDNIRGRMKAEAEVRDLNAHLEKRIEQRTKELVKSEFQFRYTLDNMMEGAQIIDFDWKYVYVNDAFLKYSRYPREEMIGYTVMEKYPGIENTEVFKVYQRCFRERVPIHMENRFVFPDGEVGWFELSFQPIPEGLFILSVDITEKKLAEEILKRSEKMYHAIISHSLLAVVLIQTDGTVLECNQAAVDLFGYSQEDLFGKPCDILFENKDGEFSARLLERSKMGFFAGELVGIRKNGQHFPCEISSAIFQDLAGNENAFFMVADISGRKISEQKILEAKDQLQKLSEHLKNTREDERKLISREVHDQLGQLGSAIKIELDWLSINELTFSEKGKVHLQNALAVVKILIQTTRQLAASLRPVMLDELGLIESLKWQCAEFKKMSGVECIFESTCDDSGLSLSLRTELFRICQEALTNVMRHAQASLVNVRLLQEEDYMLMEVVDNGKGFDASWDSGHLGLIGIRERIYSVNGEFLIDSTPGKGTKLIVKAPLN